MMKTMALVSGSDSRLGSVSSTQRLALVSAASLSLSRTEIGSSTITRWPRLPVPPAGIEDASR